MNLFFKSNTKRGLSAVEKTTAGPAKTLLTEPTRHRAVSQMSPLAARGGTVSIAFSAGKPIDCFRGAVYPQCQTHVRVPASGLAYRTTLCALAAPNHISPTSPWSRKLSSSCVYAFSQLRQERATEGQKSGE